MVFFSSTAYVIMGLLQRRKTKILMTQYARFLYKLQQDETFQKLTEAVESQTLSEIERYAHTLKGVLGNLGLEEGYQISSELVQAVREDHTEKIEPLYLVLKEQMQTYLNVIGMLEQPGQ